MGMVKVLTKFNNLEPRAQGVLFWPPVRAPKVGAPSTWGGEDRQHPKVRLRGCEGGGQGDSKT